MATAQESLLADIHPGRTYEPMRQRAYEALNSFAVESPTIEEWCCFMSCMVRFLGHLECAWFRLPKPVLAEGKFGTGHCLAVLRRVFGSEGAKVAFELTRTGKEDGLYGVLRRIALFLADEYAENEVRARVWAYWNGLSLEEKLAAADEYVAKWKHMLPEELTEGTAGRIRADLPKALITHAKSLRKFSDTVRP